MGFSLVSGLSLNPVTADQNIIRTQSAAIPPLALEAPNAFGIGLDVRVSGEAFPKSRLAANGTFQMGTGSAALKTTLQRDRLELYTGTESNARILLNAATPEITIGPGNATPDVGFSRDSLGRFTMSAQANLMEWNSSGSGRSRPALQVWTVDSGNPGSTAQSAAITKHERQNRGAPGNFAGHALGVESLIGTDGSNPVGTAHALTTLQNVGSCGNSASEYTPLACYQTVETTSNHPRAWLTDFIMVGPQGQPNLLTGFTLCVNNHYNGFASSPGIQAAMEITTQTWAPSWAAHGTSATYPMEAGIHITGCAGNNLADNLRDGFAVGLRIGGQGHAWPNTGQRVGKAIEISHWRTHGIHVSGRFSGSTGPAIQVDNGFGEIVGLNGVVTKVKPGVPVDSDFNNPQSGMLAVDTVNNRIYVRVGTTWRFAALT